MPATAFGSITAQNLPLLLWSGLALLTLALLVLMCTRWGQAKPLSKCIVLSVFAHILFIAYAYGTRLIFDHPRIVEEVPIRLATVALDTEADLDSSAQQQQPWNHFASGQVTPPDIVTPRQTATELTTPADVSHPVAQPQFDAQPEPESLTKAAPQRPVAEPREHPPLAAAAPSDLKVEVPQAVQPEPQSEAPIPEAASLPRRMAADAPPSADSSPLSPIAPDVKLNEPTRIQRLSEVPLSDQIANAAPGPADLAVASDNRSPDGVAERSSQHPLRTGPSDTLAAGDGISSNGAASTTELAERRRLGDGAPLPELYRLRAAGAESRNGRAGQYGGNAQTEAAVEAALAWLATHQLDDGHWDASQLGAGLEMRVLGHDRQGAGAEADTGITGLALLAFLGAGQSHFEGKYRRSIQRGLEYLLWRQHADGNLAGEAKLFARMYCHGIAALALSEAYALTGDERLQPYVQRAMEYTVRAQHETTGGWRYRPGDRGDMSQFGWQLMALKSAELASIRVPTKTHDGMLRFLQEVSSGTHGGLASYRRGEQASRTMTAEALVCRLFLREQIDPSRATEAKRFLLQELPGQGQANLYYWYYASLALFQLQGTAWNRWNEALQRELLGRQRTDDDFAGSWDPNTVWGGYGGRVYSTSMAALCLEVYYRYLPIYTR